MGSLPLKTRTAEQLCCFTYKKTKNEEAYLAKHVFEVGRAATGRRDSETR